MRCFFYFVLVFGPIDFFCEDYRRIDGQFLTTTYTIILVRSGNEEHTIFIFLQYQTNIRADKMRSEENTNQWFCTITNNSKMCDLSKVWAYLLNFWRSFIPYLNIICLQRTLEQTSFNCRNAGQKVNTKIVSRKIKNNKYFYNTRIRMFNDYLLCNKKKKHKNGNFTYNIVKKLSLAIIRF